MLTMRAVLIATGIIPMVATTTSGFVWCCVRPCYKSPRSEALNSGTLVICPLEGVRGSLPPQFCVFGSANGFCFAHAVEQAPRPVYRVGTKTCPPGFSCGGCRPPDTPGMH